jgi:hypothetical protein
MKKIYISLTALTMSLTATAQTFWTATSYKGAFPVTDNTAVTNWTNGWSNFDPENTNYAATTVTASTDITTNTTWSGVVLLQNKIYVKNNATLTILPGTVVRGDLATQGTLIITKGAKLIAQGTEASPIVFTSNETVGNRAEGDWGGVVLLGKGVNNQPGGIANIEGIAPTTDTEFGGTDDNDNSGILTYVRIEFAGIALQPNKEINGLTFGSVGRGTTIDNIQVSFSGDDSYEFFGGAVDCKHLIAYRGLDDDFDTDFGYRGRVQFGLAIRDLNLSDAIGDSNGFESDNDATGSAALPLTAPIFSNITLVGAKGNGTITLPVGDKFEKAFRIRRNSALSIHNSIATGWEKGLSIEGASAENNFTGDTAKFANNLLVNIPNGFNLITALPSVYANFFTPDANDSTKTIANVNWVNIFVALGSTPDARLNIGSAAATGASFPTSIFTGGFVGLNDASAIENLEIYPNPTSTELNVNFSSTENNNTISVMELSGKTVISEMNAGGLTKLNVAHLAAGTYILSISNSTAITKKLFVVAR